MKKITYLFLLLFASLSYGQTCEHVFEVEGDDDTPMVLTVNASDLSCGVGTINSVTITDAILDDYFSLIFFGESYCGEYYSFELDIDGVVSTVCADDIIGMEITDFTTFTITSVDLDEYSDTVYMGVLIEVNYTPTEVPECATITGPLTESENAYNGVISWEEVAGVAGYYVSVGTTPGGTDILDSFDVENELTYDIEGVLVGDTEYFVNVTPYNSIGNSTGCTEYSFTAPIPPTGSTCEDPLIVGPLPYSTTGDTSDYFDTIYEGVPGTSCGATNGYLGGNDVIYAYTATSTGTITIKMTPTDTYSGIFVYGSCEDIGVNCLAGAANSGTAVREIPGFEVTSGEIYYIVISTWASPQTSAYTLVITEDTCVNSTATYTIVSDCENAGGFLVDVEITDLGSATSLTISDNQNSATQAANAVGTFSFGPYSNGTSVIITINNDQDNNCFLTSPVQNQAACPPANDNCEGAISLVVNGDYSCEESTSGTNLGATASPQSSAEVSGTPNNDVWYSFVAQSTSHRVELTNVVAIAPNTSTDMGMAVYNGSDGCEALVFVDTTDPNTLDLTGLEINTTYYVRVYGWSSTVYSMTFNICIGTPPPPPANDDCIGATTIEVDAEFCDGVNNNGNNSGATDSGIEVAECFDYGMNDVWFSFVVPAETASVDISTEFLGGTLIDTEIALYSGTCDALVEEDCAQDGTVILSNGYAWNSTITDAPVTVGETYFVRVSGYLASRVGSFCLDVSTNQTLSTNGFETAGFKVYPNPVKDMLNLSYTQNISNVTVFNMLGQQVLTKSVNAAQGQVDMSSLSSGTYLVKVASDNEIKSIKVIKE